MKVARNILVVLISFSIFATFLSCKSASDENSSDIPDSDATTSKNSDAEDNCSNGLSNKADSISYGPLGLNPCAISNGKVKCWGDNQNGQLGIGDTNSRGDEANEMGRCLPEIDLGPGAHASIIAESNTANRCALLRDGTVKCWGMNTLGEMGLGDTANRTNASAMGHNLETVNLGSGVVAESLAGGNRHYCALTRDGRVKCWGAFSFYTYFALNPGFVGDTLSEMGDGLAFISLPIGRTATKISAGTANTCVVLDDDSVYCWNRVCTPDSGNYFGPNFTCTDNKTGYSLALGSIAVGSSVENISLGSTHACVLLSSGQIKCWGDGSYGQLGQGDTTSRGYDNAHAGDIATMQNVSLGTGRTAVSISVGARHSCAILDNGKVKCWGDNSNAQLGVGDSSNRGDGAGEMGDSLPNVDLGSGRTAKQLSAGATQTCVILDDDSVKCWGQNNDGRLGQGDTVTRGSSQATMGDSLPAVQLW